MLHREGEREGYGMVEDRSEVGFAATLPVVLVGLGLVLMLGCCFSLLCSVSCSDVITPSSEQIPLLAYCSLFHSLSRAPSSAVRSRLAEGLTKG